MMKLIDQSMESCLGRLLSIFKPCASGLTATPNDFLKNIDIDSLRDDDPLKLEERFIRDTYKHFGLRYKHTYFPLHDSRRVCVMVSW